jgi:N-methylhydantoinase A
MLISDIKHDYVHTYAREFDAVDLDAVAAIYKNIVAKAMQTLQAEHVPSDRVVVAYSADLRYVGQFNEVEVTAFAGGRFSAKALSALAADFHRRHDDLYGYCTPSSPIEVINLRVSVRGVTDKPAVDTFPKQSSDSSAARTGSRRAWFDGAFMDTPVFDGMRLFNGNVVAGPAIVVQPTTTILVPPDFELCCDAANSYLMHRKGAQVQALINKLSMETNT